MKKTSIILTLAATLAISGSTAFAGNTASNHANNPSACFMEMPQSSHDSRANLVWIGTTCCIPAHNMSADLSSQNSKQAVLTAGGTTAREIGRTTIVYSEKGGVSRVKEISVTN